MMSLGVVCGDCDGEYDGWAAAAWINARCAVSVLDGQCPMDGRRSTCDGGGGGREEHVCLKKGGTKQRRFVLLCGPQ